MQSAILLTSSSYILGYLGHIPAPVLQFFLGKNYLYFFLKTFALKKVLLFQELERSAPRLKTFLYFLKKSFSYISGNGTSHLSEGNFPSSKNKKTRFEKIVIFREMEFSSLRLKKLIFREMELSHISSKKSFSYIFGNGTFYKNIFFFTRELSEQEEKYLLLKSFLYFGEWNFLAPSLRNLKSF